MKPTDKELENRFLYHPPRNTAIAEDHEAVSRLTLALAKDLVLLCPEGRNLALTLTHLEDVRMRANAAIACDSPAEDTCTPQLPEEPCEEPPVAPDTGTGG